MKTNGYSVVFGQLVQKLEQITPNSSTVQDNQNEWLQCRIWTAGSKVRTTLGLGLSRARVKIGWNDNGKKNINCTIVPCIK